MKRLIAFALALAVVFGVSFALYKPERIEAAAQETMDDEWVGYFFALEPFDGRRYATENVDDYDFGVPGVPMFVTITDILPGEPGYVENDDFNHVIGAAVGDEAVGSGMNVSRSTTTAAAMRRAARSSLQAVNGSRSNSVPFTALVTEKTTPNGITPAWGPTSA